MLLLAAALLQDAGPVFPLELGNRWVYTSSLGPEITLEATRAEADGRIVLETRGLRLDDAWPMTVRERVSRHDEGIRSHGFSMPRGNGMSATTFGGSDPCWRLGSPLRAGSEWRVPVQLFARVAGKLTSLSTSTKARCLGPEQVVLDGRWTDTVRVTWTYTGSDLSGTSDAWYAAGIGPVQGRIRVTSPERTRELTWTLKAFESDPTRELFECATCKARELSKRECHDAEPGSFRAPLGQEILDRIADLGAPEVDRRQKAELRLREIGAPARFALRRSLEDPDAETRARAKRLLETPR